MSEEIEYIIPEEFRLMGKLAGQMVMELSERLHGKPDCDLVDAYYGTDYEWFINDKLDDLQVFAPWLVEAVNDLGRCTMPEDVEPALKGVQSVLESILDSMDEVKCSPLDGMLEGKPLLLNMMGRIVQDVLSQLQMLNQIVMNPELSNGRSVIDLTVTLEVEEEAAAFEAWCNRYKKAKSGFGFGSVLAGFGLGWLVFGGDDA
jgi:hypothetical protein